MASFPAAWSEYGADSLVRVRAHIKSKQDLPAQSFEDGKTDKERRREESRIKSYMKKQARRLQCKSPKIYGYPVQGSLKGANAEVRYAAGLYQGRSQGDYLSERSHPQCRAILPASILFSICRSSLIHPSAEYLFREALEQFCIRYFRSSSFLSECLMLLPRD